MRRHVGIGAIILGTLGGLSTAAVGQISDGDENRDGLRDEVRAKNVIFFVGDGMGVSTVTATRIYSLGLDGELTLDQFPFTAISKTYTTDHITPDSAGTMTAMMTGVNTNQGLIGFGPETERNDFKEDGDGAPLVTLLEQAKGRGMAVGIVTNARVTHATPAACYAHANDRNREREIALQALPTDPTYNMALGTGLDILMGGGRCFFVPDSEVDEEGYTGIREDGRDLREEYQAAGYKYVWNETQFDGLQRSDLPILGLFDRGHMAYEYDRPNDLGGEPSLSAMATKAIELLEEATSLKGGEQGYFLMVEGGRIDHAHHASNAFRALRETMEFDRAIAAAVEAVDLRDTLIIATADHSHVFNIAGYPLRPESELPYAPNWSPPEYTGSPSLILDVVFGLNPATGVVTVVPDAYGVPYTALVYGNGPGYRGRDRVNPYHDPFPGINGTLGRGPTHPNYRQESAVPLGAETHGGEDVVIYAIGPMSSLVRGTVKNTHTYEVMRRALHLPRGN